MWITKMNDSKVGVVAFYKISACLLCMFSAFHENLPLNGVFYNFSFFAKYI